MKPKSRELFSHACRCLNCNVAPIPAGSLNYNATPIPTGTLSRTRSGQIFIEGWDDQFGESERSCLPKRREVPEEYRLRQIRSRLQAIALATCNSETDHTEIPCNTYQNSRDRKRRQGANDNQQGNACPRLSGEAKRNKFPINSSGHARKSKTGRISKSRQKANGHGKRSKADSFLDNILENDINHESAPATDFTIRNSVSCPCVKFYKAVMESGHPELEHSSSETSSESSNGSSDASQCSLEDVPSGSAGIESSGRWKREMPYLMRPRPRAPPNRFHDEYSWYRKPSSVASVLFPSSGPKPKDNETHKSVSSHERKSKSKQRNENHVNPEDVLSSAPKSRAYYTEDESVDKTVGEFDASPLPSGAPKPTFITMIKTAIRDLKPFKITSKEAISKYIQFRYNVRNDCLLKYILNWMVEIKILYKWSGNYFFSKNRLVKKTTMTASTGKKSNYSKRSRTSMQLGRCSKMKRGKSRAVQKAIRRSRRQRNPSRYRKRYQNQGSNKCKKRSNKKVCKAKRRRKSKQCTCVKKLSSAKNRVKLSSRYIRRGDKVYKQEQFI